uniref:STI1/HOP DP domain-containing protein n=1 Tax=Ditylenchus dipsaci TaxID=166011 RepID=A0A915CNV8_9BILA
MIPLSSWLIYQAKKLHDYQRAKERKTEEKEIRERRERIERAREANKRAAKSSTGQEHFAADEGGEGGFGIGGFTELFKELADDPEILQMLQKDPSLIMKLTEIMQNPSNIMKHMVTQLSKSSRTPSGNAFSDKDVSADSGPSPTTGNGAPTEPTFTAKKAPEPDLD